MTALRRHVIAVVAALFALAVGIALGGGPLSYVSDADQDSSDTSHRDPADDGESPAPPSDAFEDAFAAAVAARLYDGRNLGHPTAILSMPGADPDVVEAMSTQIKAAGGGLTGVYELSGDATDLSKTSEIDSLGSQLMTELDDSRVDPSAPTYVRFGQLIGLAMSTPVKTGGLRPDDGALTIRKSLASAGLLTSPKVARLAPLVIAILPPHDPEQDDLLTSAGVFTGITLGLTENLAGLVVLGDTGSGEDGLLSKLRADDDLVGAASTVDGGDTGLGQVTAMLALIESLDGSVGSYGASGSDVVVPLS